MAKYDISWAGLDRGHEGLWRPDVWIAPLKALAKYSSVDYSDAKHAIYKELTRECPNVEWISFERQSKTARSLFRDNREPWYSTGVITFVGTSMSVSPLGKQILAGELTYSQVLARAMAGWEEHGENPFAILSDVFLRIGAYRGLSFDDVVRIMQNFREGDDVCLALEAQVYPLLGVAPRRLKAILLLMVYSGAITCVGNVYFSSDRQGLIRISGSDKFDVDEFGLKIGDQSDDGAVTIVGADKLCYQVRNVSRGAEGIRTISKKLLGEWVIAVKDDPTATAEALRGRLTGKTEVDKFEYGYFSTLYKMAQMVLNKDSIKKLSAEELSRLIKDAKPLEPSNADRLTIALKLFAEQRATWRAAMDKNKGPTYQSVNADVRAFFGKKENWDVEKLKSADGLKDFCTNHTWMLRNGKGSWVQISGYDDADRVKLVDWIDEKIVKGNAALQNVIVNDNGLKGFTNKAVSELLMKFHPESYVLCNGPTVDSLKFLCPEWTVKENYSYADYLKVLGAAAVIRDRMAEMKIYATIDGNATPDFLAVNEFIFFVSENMDLIKEKIMKEQLKPIEANKSIKKGTRKLTDAFKDDAMLQRLAAALRTKPFAILAGHSGTGKSQLVRRLAYMTCNNEKLIKEGEGKTAPGNYCMVQVKPNWHDSTDLLGYYSDLNGRHFVNTPFVQFLCKAYAYPQTPFFLCLDEMNLAPVEQYFAEYLSAVESMDEKDDIWLTDSLVDVAKEGDGKVDAGILMQIMQGEPSTEAAEWIAKHGLTIPKNLFVVGTVNMDETTCQFSRKVLDRAMTLLMNEVKFDTMGKSVDPKEEDLLDEDGLKFFLDGKRKGVVGTEEVGMLNKINKPLENTAFVVAYRFANEYALYEAALAKLRNIETPSQVAADAMDHVVLMKLLPRIHGERADVEQIFVGKDKAGGLSATLPQGSLSKAQMESILKRSGDYLTFWP